MQVVSIMKLASIAIVNSSKVEAEEIIKLLEELGVSNTSLLTTKDIVNKPLALGKFNFAIIALDNKGLDHCIPEFFNQNKVPFAYLSDIFITSESLEATHYDYCVGYLGWPLYKKELNNLLVYELAKPKGIRGCHREEEKCQKEKNVYKALFENSQDAIVYYDKDGIVENANEQFLHLLNYQKHEILGKYIKDVIDPLNLIDEHGYTKVLNGEKVNFETIRYDKHGKKFNVIHRGVPFILNGVLHGGFTIYSDISESKMLQERLIESEAKFQRLIATAQDAIIIMDHNGLVTHWNYAAEKIFDYTETEAIGNDLHELITPSYYHEEFSKKFGEFMVTGRGNAIDSTVELTACKKDGTEFPVEVSLSAVKIKGQWHSVGILRDVTERKEQEKNLINYTTEIEMQRIELENTYERINREINKAKEIHERVLPRELPQTDRIRIAAHYQPADELGGDLYNVIKVNNKLILYLADVTGHGLDSALMSAFIKEAVSSYISLAQEENVYPITPKEILNHILNQYLSENFPEDYFVCVLMTVWDLDSNVLAFSNAGVHSVPLLVTGDKTVTRLGKCFLPITNSIPRDVLVYEEQHVVIPEDATILFSTDGLTEHTEGNENFENILEQVIVDAHSLLPKFTVSHINYEFKKFANGNKTNDDITYLVAKNLGTTNKDYFIIGRCIKNYSDAVTRFKDSLTKWDTGLDIDTLAIGFNEMIMNAIEHGNSLEQSTEVNVEIIDSPERLYVVIKDQGMGFKWEDAIDESCNFLSSAERGRGIAMAKLCYDHVWYNRKGNEVLLVKEKAVR